jgi:hypothetical protein
MNDMTGITDASENEDGLEHPRRELLEWLDEG